MSSASIVQRVSVDELPEHLPQLEQELSEGRLIELVRGDLVIAEVRAKRSSSSVEPIERHIPDFMARMKSIFGDERLDTDITDFIREDRDARG